MVTVNSLYYYENLRVVGSQRVKKQETLITTGPVHVYVNRINNRLVFKIKDRYKLELLLE